RRVLFRSKSVKAFRGSFAAFRSSQWIMAGSKPPCVNQPDRLLTGIDLGIVSGITGSDESNIDLDANALAEQFRNLALLAGTAAFQRDVHAVTARFITGDAANIRSEEHTSV